MIEHIELTEAYEATPAALADVAAEAIRALNHATFPGKERLLYPSDAYEVIGALTRLADWLPQSLEQLARFLDVERRAGRVVADEGANTEHAVHNVASSLGAAIEHLHGLAPELTRAHNAAAKLGTAP